MPRYAYACDDNEQQTLIHDDIICFWGFEQSCYVMKSVFHLWVFAYIRICSKSGRIRCQIVLSFVGLTDDHHALQVFHSKLILISFRAIKIGVSLTFLFPSFQFFILWKQSLYHSHLSNSSLFCIRTICEKWSSYHKKPFLSNQFWSIFSPCESRTEWMWEEMRRERYQFVLCVYQKIKKRKSLIEKYHRHFPVIL